MSNETLHQKWEQGIIHIMNLDGWDLEWCEGKNEHYDAKGKTPKGFDCILKFKLHQAYFSTKNIKKEIYDALMKEQCMKFYFVFDSRGNYLYHLDTMNLGEQFTFLDCETNTVKLVNESVYMFSESQASIITRYSEQN